MPILKNALLVQTDDKGRKLGIYYVMRGGGPKARTVLFTELSISRLKTLPHGKAARYVGECILLGMDSTRRRFYETRRCSNRKAAIKDPPNIARDRRRSIVARSHR
jgi:hypothetical protein